MGSISVFTMLFYAAATFLLGVLAYVALSVTGDDVGGFRDLVVPATFLVMIVGPVIFVSAAVGAAIAHEGGA